MSPPRVLVIDDGESYARVVAERLPELTLVDPKNGTSPPHVEDGPAAIHFLERHAGKVDVVLLDLQFDVAPERLLALDGESSPKRQKRYQGVAILREIRRRFPSLPVVLMTSAEDVALVDAAGELAAQSMTYFLGSDNLDTLRIRINVALQESSLGLEESSILWGSDAAMRGVRRRLSVLAKGRMPILLEGETGTGKSFLAERFLHKNSGRKGAFVTLDLATLPQDLVSATLFGARRGAYTGAVADRKGVFELAHEGTLFIDEIQNASPEVQKQLLLILQDGRVRPLGGSHELAVDVKVIAASNSPLHDAVAQGRFRPDLYMRLSPSTRVRLPPLRERPDDLAFLMRRFVARAADEPEMSPLRDQVGAAAGLRAGADVRVALGRAAPEETHDALVLAVPEPAWKQLAAHPWPGNVREVWMLVYNLVTFTLVEAADALRAGLALSSRRLQVDPGLVGELLSGSASLSPQGSVAPAVAEEEAALALRLAVRPHDSLNAVATDVERQYFLQLFKESGHDFSRMAERLLMDPEKARAVRLRFNQLGLKVREITGR
jgi:two-component system nitrogen regulation response regulator GlnG